ncbi:enoyl-CoA hydratase [Youhaiella tibetensis]|uniref:Crotonase/enoyl-CoA hydratase family protein n=1 Tax=Paradevosia tibetensis TaxID=1447062 RepID=A0A5B9DII6_9HYPH|nr:crotonase/enoyl-CoA hydratase family protein [Youhaiella tibetensis]AKR58246.1 Enoyl-CoA hydratase [Devosia sp. H5989]QEE19101.1 crotonase/enoyl-CoA hydratase family protein [Youhaiella tibetensis]GGF36318.1 enoyl-CoA hydratase [Youhaiella tibetensis]
MNALEPTPTLVDISIDAEIATLTLARPEKRNALNDRTIETLGNFFSAPPREVKVAILTGSGGHFSAGLDLSEHVARTPEETMAHSRQWHRVMDNIQFGGLPVISALEGAVIGGGLEMAAATHVRIADATAFFQLPEGRRGIFVGGGGSARIGRILGADRMVEMMLTGRTFAAEEGVRLGLAHYLVDAGAALAKAKEIAAQVASNAPLSNLMIIQALSRIQDMSQADGLFTESLATALAQSSQHAQEGLKAFLEKRAPQFK